MKKIIFTISLTFGVCIFGFAAGSAQQTQKELKEDQKKEVKQKIKPYEFRLFKFANPLFKSMEEDSTKISEFEPQLKINNKTAKLYQENPFDFFKFS